MRFSGQAAIVTGAGSGIGWAIAEMFAKEGASVVAGDIDAKRVQNLLVAISASGGHAIACIGDVTQPAYAGKAVATALDNFGRLDILCNVAGINDGASPPDEMSLEIWDSVIRVNLTGSFLMTRAVLPPMLKAGHGVIVNMASIAGVVGLAGAAYSASKFGLIGLTQSVAATYMEDGLRCVAICPGRIPTRLNEMTPYSESPRTKRRQGYRSKQPVGSPQNMAEIVLFVAGESGRFINGAPIIADGGFLVM